MVNRGEEKVRVHMNVVPRSTGTQIVEQRINSEVQMFHYLCSTILFSTICVPLFVFQCYAAQHSYVPLLSLRRDSPSKIVPDFFCATS